jgi:hypothetical protein
MGGGHLLPTSQKLTPHVRCATKIFCFYCRGWENLKHQSERRFFFAPITRLVLRQESRLVTTEAHVSLRHEHFNAEYLISENSILSDTCAYEMLFLQIHRITAVARIGR